MVKHARADGYGLDKPRNVSCAAVPTDGSMETCQFDTTNASDTEIQLTDTVSNSTKLYRNPTMCVPSGGVCHHTITLTQLIPSSTFLYFASACTHATFTSTADCPRTSPDLSSTGPNRLMPTATASRPRFTTAANPGGVLSSWYVYTASPQNVFSGQAFIIENFNGIGVGGTTSASSSTLTRFLMLHDVTIDTPTGTLQCGTLTTGLNPNYYKLGNSTGIIPCQGGSPTNDFIVTLINSGGWIKNSASLGLSFSWFGTIGGGPNSGYYILNWNGTQTARLFVKSGTGVPPGQYTIHYHLQPLFGDGTGNQSGQALVSQDKTVNVPFTILPTTPLGNNPPTSFPAWSFQGEHMAMSTYWGTWDCTNLTETGYSPWAQTQFSGGFLNVPWTWITWGPNLAWNYDGGRFNLATMDLIFNTTRPDWQAAHTYTIGDFITHAGVTYIMNGVGGANTPGLSGTSPNTPPSFSTAPNTTTADGTLQWMSVGDPSFWRKCSVLMNDGYRNTQLLHQATNNFEPSMFPTGILMHYYRTGDAAAGDETGFTYTESNGHFGGLPLADTDPSCSGLTATGTSTYVVGLDKLDLCYNASSKAYVATNQVNDIQSQQMRPKALQLQEQDAYWMLLNNPSWITTDDGLRTQRMVDTNMAILDMWLTMRYEDILVNRCGAAAGCDGTAVNSQMANVYQSSQIAESLLHYYLATVYYSNTTLFPGTTVVPDERIPIALRRYADSTWMQFFDRIYDKNQSAADACAVRNPTICQGTPRRVHSWAVPYNIQGPADISIDFEFFNVAGSNSELGWLYAWLGARDSTMTIPDNGRNSPVITSYWDAAELILRHAWDGYDCKLYTATAPGNCTSWNVADFFNGGRTTLYGFPYQLSGPKEIHQVSANTNSEGINWLTGVYTWQQGAMNRSTNPCWVVANRGADGTCNAPSPYADVQPPYPVMMGHNQSFPYNPAPAICVPGATSAQNWCGTTTPIGTNKVIMDNTLTGTTAKFAWFTTKNTSQCWVTIGTSVVEPASPVEGQVPGKFSESPAHIPSLAGGTPLPLWFHTITVTGLTKSTLYHFGLYCQDAAGNPPFNFPYQIGGTTGKVGVDVNEQALAFTTTAGGGGTGPTGTYIITGHIGPTPGGTQLSPQQQKQKKSKKPKT